MCSELESTLAGKMEECELLETQITAEHEEEVRALRQQKQQLIQQLDELKENYQNILDDQEQEVCYCMLAENLCLCTPVCRLWQVLYSQQVIT